MLNHKQIVALAKIGQLSIKYYNGVPAAVGRTPDYDIKYPYELFKKEMGLDDIRLFWLLGKTNILAGGSVLNWVWGESTNEDIDFFFKCKEDTEVFTEFIKSIGFVNSMDSNYAKTYFEPLGKIILQIVIAEDVCGKLKKIFITPHEIIRFFDIHLCRFAVDSEYVYTSSRAIQDLLKLTIDTTGFEENFSLNRILKYNRKGFYISPKVRASLKYDNSSEMGIDELTDDI